MVPEDSVQYGNSGTPDLDDALYGGFIRGQIATVSGGSGTGKTILLLQLLAASSGLCIGFEERDADRLRNASLAVDLSSVSVLDLSAGSDRFFSEDANSVVPPEWAEALARILNELATRVRQAVGGRDVELVMTTEQFTVSAQHISYPADKIVPLRCLGSNGEIEKAIAEDGPEVGDRLTDYEGVLTGAPTGSTTVTIDQ
ncbi:ATPase domain-containing protein [Halosolutus gelatinilyticus]|uniref:ATPase domain-containing protein n=1 Tax=Halosolutus gelatinilyticus TaxID=2931975 RepID=UPI001FF4DDA0|nr:ATPase domain-containing protein [Halosolutus gelatinilyticus]